MLGRIGQSGYKKKEYGKACPKCGSFNSSRLHGKVKWHCYKCGFVWRTDEIDRTLKICKNPIDFQRERYYDKEDRRYDGNCPIARDIQIINKKRYYREIDIELCPFRKLCVRKDKGDYKICGAKE